MLEKLDWVKAHYEELSMLLSQPEVVADQARWQRLLREHAQLEPLFHACNAYEQLLTQRTEAEEMVSDPDMADMAQEELASLSHALEEKEREIQLMLLPKDPNDERNVVMEIRAGAGGEEAALFAAELCRMYQNYCAAHRLKTEALDVSETELGGVKEAVYNVSGKGAYKRLKYESGVHRVQRVPETETQGRIHTSTATVAVLPEAEDVEVEINDKDIRIDIFHSGGAGGQNVNKVASAVRITHFPTGIVVTCQDERSQLKNKERAFKVLRSRLYDYYNGRSAKERTENRRSLVGTGDRSERIRTYNFPQSRVTDHRIGVSQYNLDAFIMGDIDSMVEALTLADREALLASETDREN